MNTDGWIGIEKAVYALQTAAGIRLPAESSRKLVMVYDYMGRRVKKAVYADERLLSETLFVYEGWNIVEEITRQNGAESSRYFVWGLDLSQSLQGAGGVGGLLCMSDGTASYHYLYDANGNVTQLVNAADGSIAAHYEYDPFGNMTAKSGGYADANPFRFSTKYFDRETGLYNFGLRDYSPKLGRWTSRDPIGEEGGYNLYVFSLNAPVLFADPYGLEPQDTDSLSEFAGRLGIAAYTVIWQTADTFNRAVFFPLVDLLSLPDAVLKCVFGLSDDDLIAMSAQFPGGYDDLMIGVVVGSGKAPKMVRQIIGYASKSGDELVDLYRSVGVREYESIMQNKAFLPGGNSLEGRQFAKTLDEALNYADTDLSKVAVIKTQVPKSVVDQLDFSKSIDPHIFKNGVITVQPDKSALFNESLKTIEHAF